MPGIIGLRLDALDDLLVVRYDPAVITGERVRVAVEEIVDRVGN